MKVVCAWCRKVLADDGSPTAVVTHGICDDCKTKLLGERAISLSSFLNRLEFPVLAATDDWMVIDANRAAEQIVGKTAVQLKNHRGGVVIECYNSGMPGGCGKTENCAGCALRRTVADTHADGRSRYGVYASPNVFRGGAFGRLQLRVSTEKVGAIVILSIEEATAAS